MISPQQYLEGLKLQGGSLGLARAGRLAKHMGHPELSCPVIHVAGTNGKGSTCVMLERIYREAGYRTGLLTSPHLVRVNERIQVNRELICDDEMARLIERMDPFTRSMAEEDADLQVTFFEFIRLMGFQYFADKKVDLVIVETGLGGRLDASNIVIPELSVITSIGYDHEHILGHTLREIAGEKAGIIKHGRPVVLGQLPDEARERILEVAVERGSDVFAIGDDASAYPKTNLGGVYQGINAATACLSVEQLQAKFPVPQAAIEVALGDLDWAGRWQSIELKDGRRLILDAAHNEEGSRMLEKNLRVLCEELERPPVIVMGSLGENRARALLAMLCQYTLNLVLVRPNQSRACSLEELRNAVPETYRGRVSVSEVNHIFPEFGICRIGGIDDTILVCGSIYLIGEVLEQIFPVF